MQNSLATVVLAVFALLSAADGFRCPDGCTNVAQAPDGAHQSVDSSSCALCLGFVQAPTVTAISSHQAPTVLVASPRVPALAASFPAPPDHPPRT